MPKTNYRVHDSQVLDQIVSSESSSHSHPVSLSTTLIIYCFISQGLRSCSPHRFSGQILYVFSLGTNSCYMPTQPHTEYKLLNSFFTVFTSGGQFNIRSAYQILLYVPSFFTSTQVQWSHVPSSVISETTTVRTATQLLPSSALTNAFMALRIQHKLASSYKSRNTKGTEVPEQHPRGHMTLDLLYKP